MQPAKKAPSPAGYAQATYDPKKNKGGKQVTNDETEEDLEDEEDDLDDYDEDLEEEEDEEAEDAKM